MMVRKVLSLHKAGIRLTKQSFRDEDEVVPVLLENEDEESESDESGDDSYERIGQIYKNFLEKKAFTAGDGHKNYQTNIGMSSKNA
jgi:hypothetical protein